MHNLEVAGRHVQFNSIQLEVFTYWLHESDGVLRRLPELTREALVVRFVKCVKRGRQIN